MVDGLTFDEASHTYRMHGEVVPSVTQILKPLTNFDGIPPEVLRRKAALGTAVHRAVELHEQGDLDEESLHPMVAARFAAYLLWKAESGAAIKATEQKVWHPTLRYAGTLDLIAEINGAEWLIDIKNSAEFSPVWALQTAGYDACLPGRRNRAALMLNPDSTYAFHPFTKPEHAADLAVWSGIVTLHHWRTRNKV